MGFWGHASVLRGTLGSYLGLVHSFEQETKLMELDKVSEKKQKGKRWGDGERSGLSREGCGKHC